MFYGLRNLKELFHSIPTQHIIFHSIHHFNHNSLNNNCLNDISGGAFDSNPLLINLYSFFILTFRYFYIDILLNESVIKQDHITSKGHLLQSQTNTITSYPFIVFPLNHTLISVWIDLSFNSLTHIDLGDTTPRILFVIYPYLHTTITITIIDIH